MSYRTRILKCALAAALAAGMSTPSLAQSRDDTAAHSIAEKFSGASDEAKRNAEARRAREQAVRAEAAQRKAEQLRAEEAEMLARARAEASAREEERRIADEKARIEREAKATAERAAETKKLEEERLAAERLALEAKRQEEALELAARLRQAREQREAVKGKTGPENYTVAAEPQPEINGAPLNRPKFFSGPPVDGASNGTGEDENEDRNIRRQPEPDAPDREPEPERALRTEQNVTILLVMKPGNRGIRRFDKSADTVLCLGPKCYAGMGSDKPAKLMTRAVALGPVNTLGARAWGCRHSLTCVFRGVDLGAVQASVQPIDLKILRHDRREVRQAAADTSCEIDSLGVLHCANPVRSETWHAWIVPESLAQRAGAKALESAVRAGLPDSRSAALR